MVTNPTAFVNFKLTVSPTGLSTLTDAPNSTPLIQVIDNTVTVPTLDTNLYTSSTPGTYGGLVAYYFSIGGARCYVLRMPDPVRVSPRAWAITNEEKRKIEEDFQSLAYTENSKSKLELRRELLNKKKTDFMNKTEEEEKEKQPKKERFSIRVVTPLEIVLSDEDLLFINQRVMHHIPVREYNGSYLSSAFCGTNYVQVSTYNEAIDDVTNNTIHNATIRLDSGTTTDNTDLIDVFVAYMRGFGSSLYNSIIGPLNFSTTSATLAVSLSTLSAITDEQLKQLRLRGVIVTGTDFRTDIVSFQSFGLARVFHGLGFLRGNFIRIEAINDILTNVLPTLTVAPNEASYNNVINRVSNAIISRINKYLESQTSIQSWVAGDVSVNFPPYSSTMNEDLKAGILPSATIQMRMVAEATQVVGDWNILS